ncbi:SufD family Fe-S cluster assembly protein [Pantoea ananatis]
MELSTYFRINAAKTGQFERTILIADEDSYVSYIEGCSAPVRDTYQLHAAVVEVIIHKNAEVKYSTVQNWFPGGEGEGGIPQLSPSAPCAKGITAKCRGRSRKPARPLPGNIQAVSCVAITPWASSTRWH